MDPLTETPFTFISVQKVVKPLFPSPQSTLTKKQNIGFIPLIKSASTSYHRLIIYIINGINPLLIYIIHMRNKIFNMRKCKFNNSTNNNFRTYIPKMSHHIIISRIIFCFSI